MTDFAQASTQGRVRDVLTTFLRLGCTSFGGPVAHLGYFREAFVARRRWMSEDNYADLVALCQFLPGPTSSQVGMAIGLSRAGLAGGLAAWIGFTLPSALLMLAFALGLVALGDVTGTGWLHGLKLAAVAVVAQAVWGMARTLCPDRTRASLAVAAAVVVTALASGIGQILAIVLSGLAGWIMFRGEVSRPRGGHVNTQLSRRTGRLALALFAVLLVGLPMLAWLGAGQGVAYLDAFYRAGALVFGGGHVVLPLLQNAVVAPGWMDADTFLAGYGAAQALPGPLFSIGAYLGGAMDAGPNGILGALICLVGIFLPAFLLVVGVLPLWDGLRQRTGVRAALRGVNAGVVGLLAAALYDPVWTSAVTTPPAFAVALAAFLLLAAWRVSPVIVVGLCAVTGAAAPGL
jgi:chromate transporter